MTTREGTLKGLLAGELPLERVGQQMREAARRAVMSGDEERMASVARLILAELRRRGDLTAVAVHGDGDTSPDLYLVRSSRRLIDLRGLGEGEHSAEASTSVVEATPVIPDSTPDPTPELLDVDGMLGAMEEAQNLEIGDPRSGEVGVILGSILRLLGRFTPQFRLFALLHETIELPDPPGGVFIADADDPAGAWMTVRRPGTAAWLPNASELPTPLRIALSEQPGFKPVCAAAVPLREPATRATGDGAEIGLLFIVTGESWARETIMRLGERLSRFVTHRWQHQHEVNQRIHTDSLTGVHNRAYFDSQFTLELERARRSDEPLTLIIGDLDHFKSVNDRYGHQAGDQVLVTVAQRLQDELRRIDHVCRIGGEEFALILPDTSTLAARDVMRRLLDGQYGTHFTSDGVDVDIRATLSYGSVTFPDAGVDAFELYRKADAMLYLSKDSGRHRCHFWNSSGDHTEFLPSATAES